MNRFRKPSLVALMLLLIVAMSTATAFAYGRLPGRGIENGGDENPDQTLVGDPEPHGGGRAREAIELEAARTGIWIVVRVQFAQLAMTFGFTPWRPSMHERWQEGGTLDE